jgi:hypothetical protein
VITVPFWLDTGPGRILAPRTLVLGAVVALLSDVVSYSLQSEALGRMHGSLFSILSSTEPAVVALFGLVALGQFRAVGRDARCRSRFYRRYQHQVPVPVCQCAAAWLGKNRDAT